MESKGLRKLLIEIAQENPTNYLAQLLAFYYPTIRNQLKKEEVFEFLHSRIGDSDRIDINMLSISDEEFVVEEFKNLDLRIKSVEIASLRGIPDVDSDGVPFGFNFSDNDEIKNAVILANNGVGKSSVFAGMEMVYTQEIGERQLRYNGSLNQTNYNEYLRRFGSSKIPACKVVTKDRVGDLRKPFFQSEEVRRRFNPSNHFVSDFDIYHYGQINFDGDSADKNSFHSIVANSLGLSDFMQFQDILNQVANYSRKKEANELKRLRNEADGLDNSIDAIRHLLEKRKVELKGVTESNIEKKSKSTVTDEYIIRSLNVELPNIPMKEELLFSVRDFKSKYMIYLGTEMNEKSISEKEFLISAQTLLPNSEDCPLCQNSNSSIEEIRNLVNDRLLKLKQSEIEEQNLRKSFDMLFELLQQSFDGLKNFNKKISEEIQFIRVKEELNELLKLEEQFYTKYLPLLSDEDVFDFINEMSNKRQLKLIDFETTLRFIDGPIINAVDVIVSDLNEFKEQRKGLATDWLEKTKLEPASPINEKVRIEQEIKRLEAQLIENEGSLKKLQPQIELAKIRKEQVDLVKNEIASYLPHLDSKVSEIVLESFEPLKEIVVSVIKDYLIEAKLNFVISIEERPIPGEEVTKKVIVAQIINQETGEVITPDKYFNTFRFKLLGLMISLSLALATRRKYKINLPLVLDDLFASSDFVSKNSFPKFLLTVIRLFRKYTPDLPLQIILFTHDDAIFRGATDLVFGQSGYLNMDSKEQIDLYTKTKIGRMFKPNDKAKYPSSYNDTVKYWDLFYELPNMYNPLTESNGVK